VADDTPVTVHRIERTMAFMVVAIVVLSVASFIAVMIGSGAGVDFESGVWPTIVILPLIGLPIAFLLIIALLVSNMVRRRRAGGDARR
jgi:uncharacterized paraquat-inducible protein A